MVFSPSQWLFEISVKQRLGCWKTRQAGLGLTEASRIKLEIADERKFIYDTIMKSPTLSPLSITSQWD